MKKRILSLVLTLSLCCTLFVVPANAAAGDIGFDKNIDTVSAKHWENTISVNNPYARFLLWATGQLALASTINNYTGLYDEVLQSLGFGQVDYTRLESICASLTSSFTSAFRDSSAYYAMYSRDQSVAQYLGQNFVNERNLILWSICTGYNGAGGPKFEIQFDSTIGVYRIKEVTLGYWVTDTYGRYACTLGEQSSAPPTFQYRRWSDVAADVEAGTHSYHIVSEANIASYASQHNGTKMHYLDYWVVRSANSQGILCDQNGCPYAAWYNQKQTATNTERVDPETGDITLLNPAFSVMLGDTNNIENLYYDASTKSYSFDTYNYDITNNTYVTNNYSWTYNIEYTSITYIGATEVYTKTYDVYYELPDGRSSADLTKEELEQLNLEIDVINYGRGTDDTRLRSLYHFDGNTEDSSYWNYCTSFDWNDGASLTYLESNSFNGCLYLDELMHDFTLTLPSSLGSGDFTLDFRYYQSSTLTPQLDSYITVGGQRLMQLNGSHFLFGGGNYATPVGNWNHLAIVRQNGVVKFYLNGVLQGSTSLSSALTNQITFHFGTDQQTYKYLDEIRVTNFAVWTSDFTPSGVPYDTNLALILPTDSVPVADEYWSIEAENNLLSEYNLDWWDSQHSNSGSLSDYLAIEGAVASSTRSYTLYIDGVKGSVDSRSEGNHFFYSAGLLGAPSNSGYPHWIFDTLSGDISLLDSTSLSSLDSNALYFHNNYAVYHHGGSISTILYQSGGLVDSPLLPYGSYTLSMVSDDGDIGSFSFDWSAPIRSDFDTSSYRGYNVVTLKQSSVLFNGYEFSVLYTLTYYNSDINRYTVSLDISPTSNPGGFVYLALEEGAESTVTAERVSSIVGIPQENLNTPTLAVRSDIPVTDWQIGGIRPTFAERGMVYAMVEHGYITSLQIYSGYAWLGVDGRIWTGSRWIPYSSYNVITLSDMYDIADASGQSGYEYIYTETGFWSWFQKQWLEFKGWYSNVSFTGGGNTTINETTNNQFNDTEYSNDVTVFNVTKDSGKSMWDLIKGVLDIVGGVFSETGDAVDGMNTALSEPEDDTSVWYIFDVPYEYMSPVGEGD